MFFGVGKGENLESVYIELCIDLNNGILFPYVYVISLPSESPSATPGPDFPQNPLACNLGD